MTAEQLGIIITAITGLITILGQVVIVLKTLENSGVLKDVHALTNSTNTSQKATIATLTMRQATPQELSLRPAPYPVVTAPPPAAQALPQPLQTPPVP